MHAAAPDDTCLEDRIRQWGRALGFSQIGIAPVDLTSAEPGLLAWLEAGFHGAMHYMTQHGLKRARPAELVPGTLSVISARMDYLPRWPAPTAGSEEGSTAGSMTPARSGITRVRDAVDAAVTALEPAARGGMSAPVWITREWQRLGQPEQAMVSVYARGRDYHRVLRQRLAQLCGRIRQHAPALAARAFTDSAPVLEAELAVRSGLGWRGKHTLVLSREAGSMFFLGEIFVNLALTPDVPIGAHCGTCSACITACPTQAIVAPYRLDARRCISYLTIEHDGPIPHEFRAAMGNRIYGCDDCQLACPWNKFAQRSPLPDFDEREGLGGATIAQLLRWSEAEFLRRTEGSAIRRIGHARWQRNLCVAAGNALRSPALLPAQRRVLRQALAPLATGSVTTTPPADWQAEHAQWALAQDHAPEAA